MSVIKRSEEKEIKLQLDLSRTARAFKGKESLWDNEISRMVKLLERHINFLENTKSGKGTYCNEDQPLLSIAIFGSPGSGKTSLVETFARQINNRDFIEELQNNVYSLPIIKPNRHQKDDHFLYAFLAAALEAERKSRGDKEESYRSSSILTEVQQKFQEVSEYLQVLNEREQPLEDDPLGVSLVRLERHESDLRLSEKLGEFIDVLANTLVTSTKKPSLVLMPVDDPDLSMDTLISALDSYWRYLQHPRLVPLFTFTGRLAEELLRVHFESKLTIPRVKSSHERLFEASTSLMITENMAIQYLGRLFPVRNRIRLGPASARVLRARYTSSRKLGEQQEQGGPLVFSLLKNVSKLLFGHPFPGIPCIRAPLRMLILRRQLQIVDAMQEVGIDAFTRNEKNDIKSWGMAFGVATWTLLNSHRDILKEINMNLDDLYGWTPQGLRRVMRKSILQLGFEKRRELLKQWCYRIEERRNQVISLMAANIFRPRMDYEETTGDDADVIARQCENEKEKDNDSREKRGSGDTWKEDGKPVLSFLLIQGGLWFLHLCIGFYLPMVLGANKPDSPVKTGKNSETGEEGGIKPISETITGIGWGLVSGPIHAVREAVHDGGIFYTGMMFLNPRILSENIKEDVYPSLLIRTWCFFGSDKDRPWAAVSLWRGLGLMGQLLKMDIDCWEKTDTEKRNLIKNLLEKHLKAGLVVRYLPRGKDFDKKWTDVTFKNWKNGSDSVEKLAKELLEWLQKFRPDQGDGKNRIIPMDTLASEEDKDWKKCFVRRMHGESIISLFFQDLDKVYFLQDINTSWTLGSLIAGWCKVLADYWEGCDGDMESLLLSYPMLKPFLNKERGAGFEIPREERDSKDMP